MIVVGSTSAGVIVVAMALWLIWNDPRISFSAERAISQPCILDYFFLVSFVACALVRGGPRVCCVVGRRLSGGPGGCAGALAVRERKKMKKQKQ